MSLAGFKKQINKANQFMSEKIGGARGTELDDEFTDMERKIDVMGKLVDELMARTHELLQPNPASRARLSAVRNLSKIRGQANSTLYPQPEGQLGDCMVKYGRDLGDDSVFGLALADAGEVYKQMAEIKYGLEDGVKQNFIEPLQHIQTKDLKEVNHHRKKMSGRRLDYDCKRRKKEKGGATVSDEEIRFAEDKFEESKQLAESAMFNLLQNDVEQVSALNSFIQAELEYHRQCSDLLQRLSETMNERVNEASTRPRRECMPKRVASFNRIDRTPSPSHGNNYDISSNNTGGYNLSPNPPAYNQMGSSRATDDLLGINFEPKAAAPPPVADDTYAQVDWSKKTSYGVGNTSTGYPGAAQRRPGGSQPCCEALYDFEPENEGELGFKEGEMINLVSQIDENWYEGSIHGQTGFFPVNYVKIVTALP